MTEELSDLVEDYPEDLEHSVNESYQNRYTGNHLYSAILFTNGIVFIAGTIYSLVVNNPIGVALTLPIATSFFGAGAHYLRKTQKEK